MLHDFIERDLAELCQFNEVFHSFCFEQFNLIGQTQQLLMFFGSQGSCVASRNQFIVTRLHARWNRLIDFQKQFGFGNRNRSAFVLRTQQQHLFDEMIKLPARH